MAAETRVAASCVCALRAHQIFDAVVRARVVALLISLARTKDNVAQALSLGTISR